MKNHNQDACKDNFFSPASLSEKSATAAPLAPRRRFLQALTATALDAAVPTLDRAHSQMGLVKPPLALPPTGNMMLSNGLRLPLQSILQGKTTALQLMFTGCSETCSLQGALFAGVQEHLSKLSAGNRQLLSLSIDSLGDNAKTLTAWLQRFGAGNGWIAAVPVQKDIDAIQSVLQQRTAPPNNHSGQVYFFNTRGLLVWRSEELPPAEAVMRTFEKMSVA